jgi:sensor histidine kinase YesM
MIHKKDLCADKINYSFNMNTIVTPSIFSRLANLIHIVLLVIAFVVLFNMIRLFVDTYQVSEDEAISFALTAGILGGIYVGRFIALLWSNSHKRIPRFLFITLPVIIFIGIVFCVLFASKLRHNWDLILQVFFSISFFVTSIAAGLLIKLTRIRIKGELHEARTTAAHSQSELHVLQAQLSPHFLFNTLNNLYGLSISQHERLPPLLLKLSELLRYSVYEAKDIYVPLKDELMYISNYIEFEKLRIGDRLNLSIDIEDLKNRNIKIAPMLLIVFIENAFKHSRDAGEKDTFIEISLKIWNNSILFSVKNSIGKSNSLSDPGNSSNGFGLANARRRLELLYPNNFDLNIEEDDTFHNVMLRVKCR